MFPSVLLLLSLAPFLVESFSPTGHRVVLPHSSSWGIRRQPTTTRVWSATTAAGAPQLLTFQEPQTNVTVVLVGAMHYNPTSIALAADTVRELADKGALGSVIVEQCDVRWNKTIELLREKPYLKFIYKKVLVNEMRAACDTALAYQRPVILGDQRINITFASIQDTAKQTFMDLVTPPKGWKNFYMDIQQSFGDAVPLGEGYLSAFSLLDTRLLLAAPASFVRYPLSFLVRNPLTTAVIFSVLFGLNLLDQASMDSLATGEASATDLAVSLLISFLETAFIARIFLKPMLADRNVVLAQNILEQCKVYRRKNWWDSPFFPNRNNQPLEKSGGLEIVYAPESIAAGVSTTNRGNSAKVVVAILGMAHCNGIKKLLVEQRV
eukprot:scaffold5_cov169-Amphora_coffeaeformis.AAC.2